MRRRAEPLPSTRPPASSTQGPPMAGTQRPQAPTDCSGASSYRTARLDTAPRLSRYGTGARRCATPVTRRAGGSSEAEREWASLPQDLVRIIADCVLSTSGVVAYMDLRALCPSWRSAIAKPSPIQAVTDAHFWPREWIMLDMEHMDVPRVAIDSRACGVTESHARAMIDDWANQHRLFLNLSTGCFVRLRLPQLRRNILVGASDGLLVLADRNKPHAARLLNPFTGDVLPLAAVPVTRNGFVVTAVAGSDGTIIVSFLGLRGLYCANPSSRLWTCPVKITSWGRDRCISLVSYGGHVYMAKNEVVRIVGTSPHYHAELIADISSLGADLFLVESAGELLLVRRYHWHPLYEFRPPQIFRIDVERKLLEPVKDIGRRALFLGARSVSVDADKLSSIRSNCIYYMGAPESDRSWFFMYDFKGGKEEKRRRYLKSSGSETTRYVRPTVAQTLIEYCSYNGQGPWKSDQALRELTLSPPLIFI